LIVISASNGMTCPPPAIITVVGLFDWFGRGRRGQPPNPVAWQVHRDGDDVVAEDGQGGVFRARLGGARSVRIVPLSAGSHHAATSGWQVALAHADGDVLLGGAIGDWRSARDLAQLVCERTGLHLDELTQRMFSRVGQFTPTSG
jgi:hypothetical protein